MKRQGSIRRFMPADSGQQIIEALIEAFVDAWNRHDAKSLSATIASEADLVNLRGRLFQGREVLETSLAAALSGPFAASTIVLADHRVRDVSDTVAPVDATWTISGSKGPDRAARPDHKSPLDAIALRNPTGGWWWLVAHLRDLPPDAPKSPGPGA